MELKTQRLQELIDTMLAGRGTAQLGKQIGVSAVTVQNWIKGKYFPDKNALKKLADIKGWTLDEMVSYLEGSSSPTHSEISMPALREAIKKRSAAEAMEIMELAISVVRQSHLDVLPGNATIAFSKGAKTMNFSQLLQHFLATVSPDIVEQLLIEKHLEKSRLGELVAGAYPTDDDLKKVGAMMRSADFRDSYRKPYTFQRLEAIRAGSTITNGASR